ncbi:hypothetical protein ABE10_02895, partial [Bacillus toyonensis]|nr:hypothetical protein [Bacillus toyonensis]
ADLRDDTVDLERATHHGQVGRVVLSGDVLRRVLGVDRARVRGRLGDQATVPVGERRTAAGRVDRVVEDQRVRDDTGLAELVDDGDVEVGLGVELALSERDRHEDPPRIRTRAPT